ncbi:MerR family transcriptional regulator [Candidatus Dependentiae bacterium]|nr:MerR family transcriptional regulator [Candidatus Dependentiae bacterium]
MKRKKGYYSISAVAKMFSVHQQTIRLYEKQGLITPKRSSGNTRLFSEEDVNKLEEVIYLTHQLGINLAGVEMILKLQKKIRRLQKEMNALFDDTHAELKQEQLHAEQTIKANVKDIMTFRRRPAAPKELPPATSAESSSTSTNNTTKKAPFDVDNWEISYDD